jgi:membrane protease YdiL (CAAX protease family)
MPNPSPPPPSTSLAHDCGLAPPAAGWARDGHWWLALLAAVPVWLALALTTGRSMHAPSGMAAWLSFVVVQPLLEELVFRGLLQGQLLRLSAGRRIGPLTLANLCTTAGFVAMHLAGQPPHWAFAVAVPSIVFGHLRERFGSVFPAVLLHAFYNAGFALTAWWVHR